MRAARVTAFGPVEDIKVAEVERPVPASGQVLVRIAAAGVNFADTGMVRGTARRSEPPFSPGVEAAGVIEEANGAAADLVPGTRVVYWDPVPAAFAEYAVVDGWRCVPVPDDVPDDVAVALMVQGATAHYLTHDVSHLAAGQSCLVYSAAGGVGHLIVQIAKMLGARPLAVVGSDDKAALVRELGADVVINRTTQNVLEATRAATAGEGADAVYDAVGAATIEASLRATRKGGICVLYGGASGPVSEIPDELTTGITYQRTGLATYLADAEAFRGRMAQLFAWYREGKVVPRVGGTYSLDQAGEALAAIASGQTTGKLIIKP
ncbi:MAG: zinc-binding dehydrogenase [Dehalococcoidia bacterium]|nr:zinc-binding dehydrogenase [Dehalococcoidia bacterium]